MSHYQPSVTLHQQDGGMTVQAFADLHGMKLNAMRYYVTTGRVIGARFDSRSKKWTIYPPAKLTVTPRSSKKPSAANNADCVGLDAECSAPRAAPPSGAGVMAASGHADTYPMQAVIEATKPPSAKPVLTLEADALPVAERTPEHSTSASCGKRPMVYTSPEVQSVKRILYEAAARQYRQGIHYLRLEGRELSQLYAALDHERSRIRKLVGKGLVDVGNLRASDSVWQKMQAMCREGRLL